MFMERKLPFDHTKTATEAPETAAPTYGELVVPYNDLSKMTEFLQNLMPPEMAQQLGLRIMAVMSKRRDKFVNKCHEAVSGLTQELMNQKYGDASQGKSFTQLYPKIKIFEMHSTGQLTNINYRGWHHDVLMMAIPPESDNKKGGGRKKKKEQQADVDIEQERNYNCLVVDLTYYDVNRGNLEPSPQGEQILLMQIPNVTIALEQHGRQEPQLTAKLASQKLNQHYSGQWDIDAFMDSDENDCKVMRAVEDLTTQY